MLKMYRKEISCAIQNSSKNPFSSSLRVPTSYRPILDRRSWGANRRQWPSYSLDRTDLWGAFQRFQCSFRNRTELDRGRLRIYGFVVFLVGFGTGTHTGWDLGEMHIWNGKTELESNPVIETKKLAVTRTTVIRCKQKTAYFHIYGTIRV